MKFHFILILSFIGVAANMYSVPTPQEQKVLMAQFQAIINTYPDEATQIEMATKLGYPNEFKQYKSMFVPRLGVIGLPADAIIWH